MSKTNRRSSILGLSVIALLVAAAIVVWMQRTYIRDYLLVQQYRPTSQIESIASRATMTDRGVFLFYASQPEVDDADVFNQRCQRKETGSAILGCYSSGRIFIYNVTDSQLDGIREVTAAHEMLHAAWERMSDRERVRLGELLEVEYGRVKTPELDERMAYYERAQPGERANELHSIIGTEAQNISDELEDHYRTYFTERKDVVALHAGYSTVFESLKRSSEELYAKLEQLLVRINAEVASYNAAINTLNTELSALNTASQSVDRTSASAVAAFNARRAELLSRAEVLKSQRSVIDADMSAYDASVREYNQLQVRSQQLQGSIDSSLTPAPTL